MELYTFGFSARSQTTAAPSMNPTPTLVLRAEVIRVLWSSWCDAVIAHQAVDGLWAIEHTGTSLTAPQKHQITHSKDIRSAVSANQSQIHFFGSIMHEGLRGYVISGNGAPGFANQITLFATDIEIEDGVPEVQSYTLDIDYKTLDIKITSEGAVLVSKTGQVTGEGQVLHFRDIREFRCCLASSNPLNSPHAPLTAFTPIDWVTNATTSTALDQNGRVHTWTCDPRYPKCLGRQPKEGIAGFEHVPYLSETRIIMIASGGYMSAAVSKEGELFLWGQTCPGGVEELRVLKEEVECVGTRSGSKETKIGVEGEQDEFIKCLTVRIDGEEARVYGVAVGHGHILVAAEVTEAENEQKYAIFAAGDNSRGQLGVSTKRESVGEFEEVVAWRGKRAAQLVAVGWSSFVTTQD